MYFHTDSHFKYLLPYSKTMKSSSSHFFRGSVANMLVTSCDDNVCRIFVETILPDASLLDLEDFDPNFTRDAKYHTQRHKKRFVQRLKHMRYKIIIYMISFSFRLYLSIFSCQRFYKINVASIFFIFLLQLSEIFL